MAQPCVWAHCLDITNTFPPDVTWNSLLCGPIVLTSLICSHQTLHSTSSFSNLNVSLPFLTRQETKYFMCQVIRWVLAEGCVWYVASISFNKMHLHFVAVILHHCLMIVTDHASETLDFTLN